MPKGWAKIKAAASYAGVSERTMEDWLKRGLRYARLPSGLRLIKLEWIDEYLGTFRRTSEEEKKNLDKVADEILSHLKSR
jgi:predicted site-specific integrase-resolvase